MCFITLTLKPTSSEENQTVFTSNVDDLGRMIFISLIASVLC